MTAQKPWQAPAGIRLHRWVLCNPGKGGIQERKNPRGQRPGSSQGSHLGCPPVCGGSCRSKGDTGVAYKRSPVTEGRPAEQGVQADNGMLGKQGQGHRVKTSAHRIMENSAYGG